MNLIIESIKGRNGEDIPVVRPQFATISRLLSSLPDHSLGVVWGTSILEEINHYASEIGASAVGDSIRGTERFSIRSEAAIRSRLYARARYKVESFIWRVVPSRPIIPTSPTTSIEFTDVFDFAASASWSQLVQFIKPFYSATRRVKQGIEDDIHGYLAPFREMALTGNVVVRIRHGSINFEHLILLWVFYHTPRNNKLILASDGIKPKWLDSSSVIGSSERAYIDAAEFQVASAAFFNRPLSAVQAAFSIWQRGIDPNTRNLLKSGRITESQADSFLAAYAPIVADNESAGLGIIVPSQKPAPIRFKTSNHMIDVLAETELKPNEPRIVGSSRTCIAALRDLSSYTGFSNAIPTFEAKSARIGILLDKIGRGEYDDDIVVQLGTEVDHLESRISNANEMISESAAAEAATFFPLVQGLLSQFRIWGEYRNNTLSTDSNEQATVAAVEVLSLTKSRAEIMTGRARDRIEDYIEAISPDTREGEVGAVLVAENVAAQAASAVAEMAQEEGMPVSSALAKRLSNTNNVTPATWLIENQTELKAFAEAGQISWLRSFLTALKLERAN